MRKRHFKSRKTRKKALRLRQFPERGPSQQFGRLTLPMLGHFGLGGGGLAGAGALSVASVIAMHMRRRRI